MEPPDLSGASASNPIWEHLEIECEETGDIYWATSLLSSLLGGASLVKCRFIARARHPKGDYIAASIECSHYIYDSIETPGPASRTGMQRSLNELLDVLRKDGWVMETRGQWWYSYRFRRRWNPSRPKTPTKGENTTSPVKPVQSPRSLVAQGDVSRNDAIVRMPKWWAVVIVASAATFITIVIVSQSATLYFATFITIVIVFSFLVLRALQEPRH